MKGSRKRTPLFRADEGHCFEMIHEGGKIAASLVLARVPCAGRASRARRTRLAQPIQASGDQVIVSTAPDALNGDLLIYSVC